MKYQSIFFDLDGTLLPMDNDVFTKGYLTLLAGAVAHLGYEPKSMIDAMWKGVAAMVQNDRKRTNDQVFWEVFSNLLGLGRKVYEHIPYFDAFYSDGFHGAKIYTAPTPLADRAVTLAREKADKVVLATNPFFPRVAVDARLSWAEIAPERFDLITSYENAGCCKPNPAYYTEICEKLDLDPAQCLMVGNNAEEDIRAAQAAGLSTFLLTDCLIAEGELPEGPQGDFQTLIAYLENL
ncbi:MAG: HAD family hydrolase [Ruminococcaceae bacterium]|nr:HAD family hydrolase [Oscillospiraceae bacterium]